ncbi:hypothetical protein K491DRAFT_405345 [Lophiostoma macrostomum CBS 122681]|uniref:HIT-type domain-containing protein n=1 Tax=Lophiostoma macrostomum CBS 122681 TaxID=1314788 RepID=A0A6A6T7F2_9PLEO|nr:hypothetical protein K491DRAFT_405345 [Lophiostoma macrostomum CBS 122681]
MAEILCGICTAAPKKYKCPNCSIPYCSLACFKHHKPSHEGSDASSTAELQPVLPEIPQPPPPAPPPRYLRQKIDFSKVSSNPKFAELLTSHPTLLTTLQRIYASTIEPDPEVPTLRHRHQRGGYRGRGRGDRGWRRGGGYGGSDGPPTWTQKKGDATALKTLKGVREGKKGAGEQEAMIEFVKLVQETLQSREEMENE